MQEQVARYSQMNNQEAASTEDLQNIKTQLTQAKAQLTQAENLVIQDDALLSAANAQIEQDKVVCKMHKTMLVIRM